MSHHATTIHFSRHAFLQCLGDGFSTLHGYGRLFTVWYWKCLAPTNQLKRSIDGFDLCQWLILRHVHGSRWVKYPGQRCLWPRAKKMHGRLVSMTCQWQPQHCLIVQNHTQQFLPGHEKWSWHNRPHQDRYRETSHTGMLQAVPNPKVSYNLDIVK